MLSVVFDMDGVLFDTQRIYSGAWIETAKQLGIDNIEQVLGKCIGCNRTDQLVIIKEHYGESFPFERFYELKDRIFDRHIEMDGVPLKSGVQRVLKVLKKLGARVAIASSSRKDVIMSNLVKSGLLDYFDVIIGGDMVEHSKPFPDIYLKACEALDSNPYHTYAVEDSYNGLDSALKAGLRAVMIPDMLPPTEEYDAKIYQRFESLNALSDYFILKSLMENLWKKYPYASVLYEKQEGKRYQVSQRGINVSADRLSSSQGYVIKAYDGNRYAEYSFNNLSEDSIETIEEEVGRCFYIPADLSEGFEFNKYPAMSDEACHSFKACHAKDNPKALGDAAITEIITGLRNKALSLNSKIIDCTVNSSYRQSYKLFISKNREMAQDILWMTAFVSMMAKKGEVIKTYFKTYSSLGGTDVLSRPGEDLNEIVDNTVNLLDAGQIIPGKYECICAPDVTGMIAHEAFGHGVEMDMFVKDRALASEYIGKYVASELVTMHDGARAADEAASYDFDDEGVSASDTVIIDRGVLKTGISDSLTALALNTHSTGNGRRESYERKAYTRMTNTFFEGGSDSFEDMIKSVKYGFLLENATCGMEDPKNWGIQCMVNAAKEIKDGELTGKVFSPVVLSGYVPDLLKSISMMSDKVYLSGGGYCGKGHKEWVKVSDGGPYIKAEIELG